MTQNKVKTAVKINKGVIKNHYKRCIVFLLVRTSSKRLPKKALMKIKTKPTIILLVNRIAKSSKMAKIIICTTKNKSDDILINLLEKNNIEYFRGPSSNILRRIYLAAKKYEVNKFIVVEGDDVFCEPEFISHTCEVLQNTNCDFVKWKNVPIGSSPLGINLLTLKKIVENKSSKKDETGWHVLLETKKNLKKIILEPTNKKLLRPEIRLTLDYKEDFLLIKKLYDILPKTFSLKDIINILDKNPTIAKINETTQKKWKKNWIQMRHEQSKCEIK